MIITPAMQRARTEGRRALLAVVYARSEREVAERIGVAPSTVSGWCAGKWRPADRMRLALEAAFGVPAESWGPRAKHWRRRPAQRRAELGHVTMARLAAVSRTHAHALRSYLAGRTDRILPSTCERIELALIVCGLTHLLVTHADHAVAEVARRARVEPDVVRRYLRHGSVRALERRRIFRALEAHARSVQYARSGGPRHVTMRG
jgi:transcriptional regulator with XRE-family HTH domain